MRYLILFLLPSLAFAVPLQLNWDANPPLEQITGYTVFKNDILVETITLTTYSLDALSGDCLHVTASNILGESGKSEVICLPPTASSPGNIKIINIVVQ